MTGLTGFRTVGTIGTGCDSSLRIGTRELKASHTPLKRVFSCQLSYGGGVSGIERWPHLERGSSNLVRPRHQSLEPWVTGYFNPKLKESSNDNESILLKDSRLRGPNLPATQPAHNLQRLTSGHLRDRAGRRPLAEGRVMVKRKPKRKLKMQSTNIVAFPGARIPRNVLQSQNNTILESYFRLPDEEQREIAVQILGRAFLNSQLKARGIEK